MPETVGVQAESRTERPRFNLNSDGKRHPLLNATAGFVFIAGIASFVLALIVRDHFSATVVGMVAFGVGLLGQMLSATREERIFLVAGIVAGFVGMGLGIAHGGFG
jgi:hypothetical protein